MYCDILGVCLPFNRTKIRRDTWNDLQVLFRTCVTPHVPFGENNLFKILSTHHRETLSVSRCEPVQGEFVHFFPVVWDSLRLSPRTPLILTCTLMVPESGTFPRMTTPSLSFEKGFSRWSLWYVKLGPFVVSLVLEFYVSISVRF